MALGMYSFACLIALVSLINQITLNQLEITLFHGSRILCEWVTVTGTMKVSLDK